MSSSPSFSRRPRAARVIRRPGSVLPPAPMVHSHGLLPPTSASEPVTSLEVLLAAAREEAFEAGREAGLAEAADGIEAQRAAAVAEAAARIGRTAASLRDVRSQVVDEVVGDVVGLAFELLEVLVGRELALAGTPARDAVVRALALAPDRHDLVVRVHPDCGLDDEAIAALAEHPSVMVVRDAGVDPNGCQVTAGACHIDVQLPAALARVRRCLEELHPGGVRPTAAGPVGPGSEGAGPEGSAPTGTAAGTAADTDTDADTSVEVAS